MHSFRVATILVAAFAAISHPRCASADEPLQPLVQVTATRVPTGVDDALAHVSVITREDIEASATQDLVTVLRQQAGVDIVRGGGLGQQTSVFLRGSNSNHVLVLIDGVRVSSANTGAFAWEHLALDQVERIEIVRGPRAAVYGSDAIGGVIQVFTRRPDGAEASAAAGNHDTFALAAGYGRESTHGRLGVRVAQLDSGGINAQRSEGFAFDPDDDGIESRTLALDGSRQLGTHVLSAQAQATDSEVEFDQGVSLLDNHQLAATLGGPLAADWTHRLTLAGHRETLETAAFFQRLDSRREQLDWQHEIDAGAQAQWVFGLAHLRERGTSTSTFDGSAVFDQQRRNSAGYGAWRGRLGAHDAELALRHDHSSVFGGETTGQAAWGWQLGDATRLHASHGIGFRAPNFNELYSPGFGGLFAGNPGLEPERSQSSEFGLRHAISGGSASVHAFRTDIANLIDFSGADFQATNVRRARIDGIEVVADAAWGAWAVSASATWQDARDLGDGSPLLRRPSRKAAATLGYRFANRARIAINAHAVGPRPDFGGELPGHALLGIGASWPLGNLVLDLGIENLFDREYTLVNGFNTPGQTVLLRARWEH